MWFQALIILPIIFVCWEFVCVSFSHKGKTALAIFVLLSLFQAVRKLGKPDWKRLGLAVLFSTCGALSAFLLANYFRLGPVLASGIVGLVGARLLSEQGQLQLYLGSFVGMSAAARFPHTGLLVCAGAAAGVLWCVLEQTWSGVGGRLGTIAAAAVLITLLFSGGGF